MVCGSAADELLPIYVVYKAVNLCENWVKSGLSKVRYACSKSGWVENTFFDQFLKLCIPVAKANKDVGTALFARLWCRCLH